MLFLINVIVRQINQDICNKFKIIYIYSNKSQIKIIIIYDFLNK